MTHEDHQELLAVNALTALDAADTRALETHLESCSDCRSEMNEWEETAAFLALDANTIEPSTELRERILADIRAAARDPGLGQTKGRAERQTDFAGKAILPFKRSQKNVWVSLGSFGSIAASLALVALIISLIMLWQQNRATQRELARLSTQMQEAKEQLANERKVLALFTSPGARMRELAGTAVAPGAHAMVAYDKEGQAMLMAKGLPPPPKGMAYQLWYIVGKKPMPGKVFTTDAAGNGTLEDQIPDPALGSAAFAITLEPEGGVLSPTGAIYLSSAA